MDPWKRDWPSFINALCSAWNEGMSDEEVTRKFGGTKVLWEGVVSRIITCEVGPLVVTVRPGRITFTLADGRTGFASDISLVTDPNDQERWAGVEIGDRIRFETEIVRQSSDENPFAVPGIEWANIGGNKGYVSLATTNARIS